MNESLIQCENLKPEIVTVDENYIKINRYKDNGNGKPKTFNPFEIGFYTDKPLFLKFISIDTDNLLSIEQFVNEYGLLGLYLNNELNVDKDLNDLMSSFTLNQVNKAIQNDYNVDIDSYTQGLIALFPELKRITARRIKTDTMRFYLESTKLFIQEVKIMRCLSNLYNAKAVNEFGERSYEFKEQADKIESYINELKLLLKDNADDFKIIEEVISKYNIKDNLNLRIVSYFVSEKMKNTEFSTEVVGEEDGNPKIKMKYFVPTLLTGLYTMFYFHIINGGLIHQCPVCGSFYDNDNTGCSIGCINVVSSRKYREKKSKDPIFLEYENLRKTMYTRIKAKGNDIRISKIEYKRWNEAAKEIRDKSKSVEEFQKKISEIKYKEEE